MVVTTPVNELLAIAKRYEAETRWAQAAEAYGQILANMPHPTAVTSQGDRKLIEDMRTMCIARSHETASNVATTPTEDAKLEVARQDTAAAHKRAQALQGG